MGIFSLNLITTKNIILVKKLGGLQVRVAFDQSYHHQGQGSLVNNTLKSINIFIISLTQLISLTLYSKIIPKKKIKIPNLLNPIIRCV